MKLNYRRTLFVGFAFFLICAFWQAYDTIIPKILTETFRLNETLSGAIMALDNILALFLLPLFGALSDRTSTKIGRRMPFILLGTACAAVLMNLLPVLDNLQRALDTPCADENYITGIQMIRTGLEEFLKKMGVETFGKAGEPFDPNLHNAVMHIEDENLEKNVVAQVFQSGYRRGDRILRHAMVQQAN